MRAEYVVMLTEEEMELGALEGKRRRLRCVQRGARLRSDAEEARAIHDGEEIEPAASKNPFRRDTEGACAELAVHILINRHWSGINRDGADVGVNTGVRHTPYSHGHLLIYQDDPDSRRMFLVTGTPPRLIVRGWVFAGDFKHEKYNRKGRPKTDFWVKQENLMEVPLNQLNTARIAETIYANVCEKSEKSEESLFSRG